MSSKPHSTEPEHPFLWLLRDLKRARPLEYDNRPTYLFAVVVTETERGDLIRALKGWKGER